MSDEPPSLILQEQLELQHLLHEFLDVLSQHSTDIGRTHLITHHIHTHTHRSPI